MLFPIGFECRKSDVRTTCFPIQSHLSEAFNVWLRLWFASIDGRNEFYPMKKPCVLRLSQLNCLCNFIFKNNIMYTIDFYSLMASQLVYIATSQLLYQPIHKDEYQDVWYWYNNYATTLLRSYLVAILGSRILVNCGYKWIF